MTHTKDEVLHLAKRTGLIERLYYKGTTAEDTDAISRFYTETLAHAKEACVKICEQIDEEGEGPDQWSWHAKDYAAAIKQAISAPTVQEPVAVPKIEWVNTSSDWVVHYLQANSIFNAEQIGEMMDFAALAANKFYATPPAAEQPAPVPLTRPAMTHTKDEVLHLAKRTGLIERLYYKGTTAEDTDAISRFYTETLAHAKEACVKICEQIDEEGEGPDQWSWHAKDYAAAIKQAISAPVQPVAHCEAGPEFCQQCHLEDRSLALAAAVRYVQNNTPKLVADEICMALTTPPAAQRTWVGLTNEDKLHIECMGGKSDVMLAEKVEAKLKERNV